MSLELSFVVILQLLYNNHQDSITFLLFRSFERVCQVSPVCFVLLTAQLTSSDGEASECQCVCF